MSDVSKHERKLCFEIQFASVAAGGDSSEVLAHAAHIELGRELESPEPLFSIEGSAARVARSAAKKLVCIAQATSSPFVPRNPLEAHLHGADW